MKVCIVGGGTAGWITLAYIVSKLDIDVTIIHSNEIDIIGVGESTSPTIRQVADAVGVDEYTWMRDAKATFKYGIDFIDWNNIGSHWFHSFEGEILEQAFTNPVVDFGKDTFEQKLTSIDYFLKLRQNDASFDIDKFNNMHGPMWHILGNGKGHYNTQRQCNISKYAGYAYHVSAYEYSQCLRKHTPKEKFTEIVDTIIDVEIDDTGVKSLRTKSGNIITSDIFIDCTGMKRLLIGKLTGFTKFDKLKNNRAIFGGVDRYQNYRATTQAHAQDAGWIWSIPTWGRMGSGYVYSSDYITDDKAYDTIVKFWADKGYKWIENNRVSFTSGRCADLAIKNVFANGLAQSFIEPLEATSIMITCWTVIRFVEIYNRNNRWDDRSARMLNTMMAQFLDNTKSFVGYHYQLSERIDTDYWRDQKNPDVIQEVNDIISSKLRSPMLQKGQTSINKFNWTSLLIGFNKPFNNRLEDISQEHIENYLFFVKQAEENYKFLVRNNPLNEQIIKTIHLKSD
jgi:tryptophan halogenase